MLYPFTMCYVTFQSFIVTERGSPAVRAFAIDEFGKPGSVKELPDPTPGEGEVVIRVAAASINPMDAVVAAGGAQGWAQHRFPLVPGLDAAGTVTAVGSVFRASKWATKWSPARPTSPITAAARSPSW